MYQHNQWLLPALHMMLPHGPGSGPSCSLYPSHLDTIHSPTVDSHSPALLVHPFPSQPCPLHWAENLSFLSLGTNFSKGGGVIVTQSQPGSLWWPCFSDPLGSSLGMPLLYPEPGSCRCPAHPVPAGQGHQRNLFLPPMDVTANSQGQSQSQKSS